jgi:pimeloyl-ACP methyl ester carboxylesterase
MRLRALAACAAVLLGSTACGDQRPSVARESPTNPADSSYEVAPADTSWRDPAPHRDGYARNGRVRIHYLNFGGRGEPLVLLTGLGSSAHIFDDLAPRFTDRFRVVAITRRGHAESDHPATGYALDTLVGDIKAVVDTLGFRRINLAGHSIAGGELTRFAILYPDRVRRLLYLDALLDPVGLDALIAEDTIKIKASETDFQSYDSARSWFQRCFYGFWSTAQEADFRLNTTSPQTTDAIYKEAVASPSWRQELSAVRAPSLVLYTLATLEQRRPCVAKSADQKRADRARDFLSRKYRPYQSAAIARARREMPHVRIRELQGHHFLFLSNQSQVVREMRDFLLRQ